MCYHHHRPRQLSLWSWVTRRPTQYYPFCPSHHLTSLSLPHDDDDDDGGDDDADGAGDDADDDDDDDGAFQLMTVATVEATVD